MQDKKSLLIVDDDIPHRTMLRILLNWRFRIFEADDGAAAIREVTKRRFDLILIDIRMTNVSGIETLDQIKSLRPEVPVVMKTAYFSPETAAQVQRAPPTAWANLSILMSSNKPLIVRSSPRNPGKIPCSRNFG